MRYLASLFSHKMRKSLNIPHDLRVNLTEISCKKGIKYKKFPGIFQNLHNHFLIIPKNLN